MEHEKSKPAGKGTKRKLESVPPPEVPAGGYIKIVYLLEDGKTYPTVGNIQFTPKMVANCQDLPDVGRILIKNSAYLGHVRAGQFVYRLADQDKDEYIASVEEFKECLSETKYTDPMQAIVPAPPEGEPPSKKAIRSLDEYKSSDPVSGEESIAATKSYFKKLLEAPLKLPRSTEDLRNFLSTRTEKLPLLFLSTHSSVNEPDLLKLCTSEAERPLASFVESAFSLMSSPSPANEATSSHQLCYLTGDFIRYLNNHAAADRKLQGFQTILDSANPSTSKTSSKALRLLLRPDFQLFLSGVLILRWENKIDEGDIIAAMVENTSKLKVWSPLYYGTLPYVIGGCCGGGQFRWLKLFPSGKEVHSEFISQVYDLNMLSHVALFLHSTIRMHCLLQKLQEELTDRIRLKLYLPLLRSGGGKVMFYPDFVSKEVRPALDRDKFERLYASIKGSRYLIQLKDFRALKGKTLLQLEPVGDPHARPGVLKDLAAALHDILHGLADLHNNGYTHRDLRWENCIKVNVESEWKWVIIDLEAAGSDGEEWKGDGLTTWDEKTLEELNGKKIYTKASDMYQLGKLLMHCLATYSPCRKEERDLYTLVYDLGEKLRLERPAARTMLNDICKTGCQRCGKLDRATLNS